MSISINAAAVNQPEYQNGQKQNKNTIFAGNTGLGQKDTNSLIEQKRGLARKQAMKLIGNAWDKDQKSAQGITDMEKIRSDKVTELSDLRAKIKDIEESKKALQEEYGINPDSQEQKDVELLQKYQNYMGGSTNEEFSKEEVSRLEELQHMPRTEYQNAVLKQNAATGGIKHEIRRKEDEIIGMKQSIMNAELEQLKSQDMLKAGDAADAILEASNDEILGMLVQDGMDKIEEQQKEEQEKAEEAAEKKEEKQDQIDEAKEERKDQEDILKNASESDKLEQNVAQQNQTTSSVEEAQKNIQKILQENNLVNEDLKGIKIDFNF